MFILQKSKHKLSSRRQINIEGASNGILALPNNQYCKILEVSSINFELKSEEEQDALIDIYESFLNSLPCPMQTIIRIRELDISGYLDNLQVQLNNEEELIYQKQLHDYRNFISELVSNNKILSRHFYVVIPYTVTSTKGSFTTAKEQLQLNCDIVSRGLMRLGIKTRQLSSLETIDLFYSFYNPDRAKQQPITKKAIELINNQYITRTR